MEFKMINNHPYFQESILKAQKEGYAQAMTKVEHIIKTKMKCLCSVKVTKCFRCQIIDELNLRK